MNRVESKVSKYMSGVFNASEASDSRGADRELVHPFFVQYDQDDLNLYLNLVSKAGLAALSTEHFRIRNIMAFLRQCENAVEQQLAEDVIQSWRVRESTVSMALMDGESDWMIAFPSASDQSYGEGDGDKVDAAVRKLKESGVIRSAQFGSNLFSGIIFLRLCGMKDDCPANILGDDIDFPYTVKRIPRAAESEG